MSKINLLLIGSGGREHALAWKIKQSSHLNKLFIAPGNPGTARLGQNLQMDPLNFEAVKKAIVENHIDIVVVGPEEPLVRGLHDYLASQTELANLIIIGPRQAGAQLEGSKDFAKAFMVANGIPTASYKTFTQETIAEAKQFLSGLKPPYVLKADGLAAGKGVIIEPSLEKAQSQLDEIFAGRFGQAGQKVVIEEFLTGIEVSVFVLTDGKSYVMLPQAKDYKRIGVGDTGPNTGGMGAVSPVTFADEQFMEKVEKRIVQPTLNGLINRNITYQGFIFFGLMSVEGEPYVIEYNVRLGDPETQAIMPRIKSDLLTLLQQCGTGELNQAKIEIDKRVATTVILASAGYPGTYSKGKPISGPQLHNDTLIFEAGTSMNGTQRVTSGGRVMACTALGNTLEEAIKASYKIADSIYFEGKYFRTDIGNDL